MACKIFKGEEVSWCQPYELQDNLDNGYTVEYKPPTKPKAKVDKKKASED